MNNSADQSDAENPTPPVSDHGDSEPGDRLLTLRSMLAATEARQSKMKRVRHRTLAAGVPVRILSGSHKDVSGVILDADYIHSKVLVELLDEDTEVWINFPDVLALAE